MIELVNVSKIYNESDGDVVALDNINLTIKQGDIFGVVGMSGAGKSTLIRLINMLERPTSGQIIVNGTEMTQLSEKELRMTQREISMIFQKFNLLMQKNCLDNVCLPLILSGVKKKDAKEKAVQMLELVGIADKMLAYPSQLSGGQQQRVAIARALILEPKILLCDEATSALDPMNTLSVLNLIQNINETMGITIVVITHQMNIVKRICKNVAVIDNGRIVEQGDVESVFANPNSEAAKKILSFENINQ